MSLSTSLKINNKNSNHKIDTIIFGQIDLGKTHKGKTCWESSFYLFSGSQERYIYSRNFSTSKSQLISIVPIENLLEICAFSQLYKIVLCCMALTSIIVPNTQLNLYGNSCTILYGTSTDFYIEFLDFYAEMTSLICVLIPTIVQPDFSFYTA